MWWVRRAAIFALGVLGGAGELDALTAALADPFWRVRYAAVRVLGVLGARDLEVRAALGDDTSSTAAFLRSAWGPAPHRGARARREQRQRRRCPPSCSIPTPPVVTARLAAGSFDPVVLVELLCDPHAPLRILAAQRVAASGNRRAPIAALDWLEEPRIPHVAATVEHVLDGLGDDAVAVATTALARPGRHGGARWAIAWVAATRHEPLFGEALSRARDVEAGDRAAGALRRAAMRLADAGDLRQWACEPVLVDAIAEELDLRRDAEALLALDATGYPRARALRVAAAVRLARWDVVTAALDDAHHGPRAIAIHALARAGRIAASDHVADVDPAIREAAVHRTTAAALVADADPWVARAAIAELARLGDVDAAGTAAVATRALASPDPVVRASACGVVIASPDAEGVPQVGADDTHLAGVVTALGDADPGVRAAAHEALDRARFDADARVRAILPALAAEAHARATAWLGRRAEDAADITAAVAELVAARARRGRRPEAGSRRPEAGGGSRKPEADVVHAPVSRRAFGRAGFDVAPLAISGAYDPSPSALELAAASGVDLYFWEPSYDGHTRFLRRGDRRALRLVAGTYHADAGSIEADVDRALRWLRRDTLDVFLLFWSRSPARVEPAAHAVLARLRDAGKIRAIGFSTHDRKLARAAIAESPWDVVMTRHSAAHPGIETELLPFAQQTNTAVLTFSALCYGRMLGAGFESERAPTAAECYRYSLAQPGVTACISAPRRRDEMIENLDALRSPWLDDADVARLRAHGVFVRAESQRFNSLLRQRTRDAAAAARELLASELPPHDEIAIRPMPRAPLLAVRARAWARRDGAAS